MRRTWNEYFMSLAKEVATRSTCNRASVGCVITKDNRIISTGYNGAPHGLPHCDEAGHLLVDKRCKRATHAEANAIVHAKESLSGTVVYVTHEPCIDCSNLLSTVGVSMVYYSIPYGGSRNHPISFTKVHYETDS